MWTWCWTNTTNGLRASSIPTVACCTRLHPWSATVRRESGLRAAARTIERARLRQGHDDPDASIDHWTALVAGRWSLVDHFDADGRRFVLAVKNDPMQPDPRGLTDTERQVVEFVGLGRTAKQIAYTLGVTPSAVKNTTQRVQRKLGLASGAELAAFFAPAGLRRKMAEVQIAGEPWLLASAPLADPDRLALLTPAEQEVALLLLAGSTNADIARRRGSAERTVANQVASIFGKLRARSRSELAACLSTPAREAT